MASEEQTPNRTPGRDDFGRWDPMDEPTDGMVIEHLALNHGRMVWSRRRQRLEHSTKRPIAAPRWPCPLCGSPFCYGPKGWN
jgi:hypothetical protein